MSKTQFASTIFLEKMVGDLQYCKDIIEEAYKQGGVDGVSELTLLQRSAARRALMDLGLLKKGRSDETLTEFVERRKKANLRHLELTWGWTLGQDVLVLNKSYQRIAKYKFKCGKICFKKDDPFTQYGLPWGSSRKYMEENGLVFFQSPHFKIPVTEVRGCKVLSARGWEQPLK